MIIKYYDFSLEVLDEVADILERAFVSWSWYSGGALCVKFDFKNNVKALLNAYPDPQVASTMYAQLMVLSQCKGRFGQGRFVFQNFDIL